MNEDEPILVLEQGSLRGSMRKNLQENMYYSFSGIPYARPPIGHLRFKAPEEPVPWTGTFNASRDVNNACPAKDLFTKEYIGTEDCLVLNVYTPKSYTNAKLPVMVWIHGGGFICGSNSPNIYGPEFLLTQNIVLVAINYRLGILGFISFEDPSLTVPGNAGFKDMVMALKWVKKNIDKFGGDQNNITVFGESAGGMAVHLLMLSPQSKGLFHKAIAQSGCALNPGSRGRNFIEDLREILNLQCSEAELLKTLREMSITKLLEVQDKIAYFLDPNKVSPWGLVLEKYGEDAFMTEEPLDILISKKCMAIPLMIGYTKDEGMVVKSYKRQRYEHMVEDLRNNIPFFLGNITETNTKILADKIKNFYFKNSEFTLEGFYQMVTDTLFLYGICATVRKYVNFLKSPVYFYRFSLETSLQFLKTLSDPKEPGCAHGDDIGYLFKTFATPRLQKWSIEYRSVEKIVKLWTNFARDGDPTPDPSTAKWKPATIENMHCLDLNVKMKLFDTLPEKDRMDFWDDCYKINSLAAKFL